MALPNTNVLSIISPLCTNILLHKLDCYIEDSLIPKYTQEYPECKVESTRAPKGALRFQKMSVKPLTPKAGFPLPPNPPCRCCSATPSSRAPGRKNIRGLSTGRKPRVACAARNGGTQRPESMGVRSARRPLGPSREPIQKVALPQTVKYLRYADSLLIGVIGSRKEATDIRMAVQEYLYKQLQLEINSHKSAIYHATTERTRFLGADIIYSASSTRCTHPDAGRAEKTLPNRPIKNTSQQIGTGLAHWNDHFIEPGVAKRWANSCRLAKGGLACNGAPKISERLTDNGAGPRAAQHTITRAQLYIPIRTLLKRATDRGYARENADKFARATANSRYSASEDRHIVNHFSDVIRGLVNYYSFANKRSSLWKVVSIYRKSCALTLAKKHNLRSAHAAFCKFGPNLRITERGKPVALLEYPDSLKTTNKFNIKSRASNITILEEPYSEQVFIKRTEHSQLNTRCELCASLQSLGLYQLRPVQYIPKEGKDALEIAAIAKSRKQITLCRECHRYGVHKRTPRL